MCIGLGEVYWVGRAHCQHKTGVESSSGAAKATFIFLKKQKQKENKTKTHTTKPHNCEILCHKGYLELYINMIIILP